MTIKNSRSAVMNEESLDTRNTSILSANDTFLIDYKQIELEEQSLDLKTK